MGSVVRKFFADRGTHLAAMIAYFALLSFVPLLLLSLALLGLVFYDLKTCLRSIDEPKPKAAPKKKVDDAAA